MRPGIIVEISVLFPVQNGVAYLDETLTSLRKQSFADYEVLCIYNCSSDDSAQILHRHATEDSRFIYPHKGTELGSAPKAAHHAARKISGQWFVYSSQDDLFSEDWPENMHVRAHSTEAKAVLPDVVFCHAYRSEDRNHVWSYDFVYCRIDDGKIFRT